MFSKFFTDISKFHPIRGKREMIMVKYISKTLENSNINFELQQFKNSIPTGKCKLDSDFGKIESMPASFKSGKINEKNLISNIIIKQDFEIPNISFNPYCKDFSLVTFYFEPSICVKSVDVKKIIESETISGIVKIRNEKFKTANIIAGDLTKPENIIFTHFDTVLNGSVDNSSSVALLLSLITEKIKGNKNLEKSLIIFSGSEELSFEKPFYWGYGYRVFERDYFELLENSKKIIVVDCIGFDKCYVSMNKTLLKEAFPIANLDKFSNKIYLVTSVSMKNIKYFYSFYHSTLDKPKLIKKNYIIQAKRTILKLL